MTQPTQAVTDVPEFITDLDGGQFDRSLSIALSQTAAAVVDNNATGEVKITMKIKPITGSHQVRVEHTLEFKRPTMDGKASEVVARSTVMHVGQFGKLTLAQPPRRSSRSHLAGSAKTRAENVICNPVNAATYAAL